MPLDTDSLQAVPAFTSTDLLYGLDTGQIKYRTFFRKKFYPKDSDVQHKIDYYTQGLGVTPGEALPKNWNTANKSNTPLHQDFRGFLKDGTSQKPFQNRYNPEDASEGNQWNARFRRTSKAGLQWALLVNKWNVHFLLNELEMRDVVLKQTRNEKGQATKGSAGLFGSRRITYCEIRWIYRHRDFSIVKSNVQFWRYDLNKTNDFLPVKAPWLTDPKMWEPYKPKLHHISQDHELAEDDEEAPPVAQSKLSPAEQLQRAAIRGRELDDEDA